MEHSAAIMSLLALGSCAHQREVGTSCPLRRLPVEVAAVAGPESAAPPSHHAAIEAALRPRGGIGAGATPENFVLSGGGKWGAFGAGFLEAWPGRPSFRAVTGVSTGALQSTFAFLGDDPVAADRVYPPALDLVLPPKAPQPGKGRRYLDDLSLAYTFASASAVVNVLGDEVTALRKGAAADTKRLRRRLDAMIDAETFRRVGVAGQADRGLFVGVVDMDDGRAYAVDMTDLARKALAAPANAEQYRQCYVDILIAASTEPISAFPVFIKNQPSDDLLPTRMYMDAGLRNGVFLQEVLRPDGKPKTEAAGSPAKFNNTVIVNGALSIDDLTQKPGSKWSKGWSLLTLAARSKDMLVNQIYEFSVWRVREFGASNGVVRVRTTRGYEAHPYSSKTCRGWQDEPAGKPFPPAFMQCLIAFGRETGAMPKWDFTSEPTRP